MTCPFCRNTLLQNKFNFNSRITGVPVTYYQCKSCGSLIQSPYPDRDTVHKYYEQYEQIKKDMNPGYLNPQAYTVLRNERFKTFLETGFDIQRIKNSVNVELGCANGLFLKFLIEQGSGKTTGIDISETLLKSIQLDNVTLICGSLGDIEEKSVDNLFLFNVLEHVPDIDSLMYEIIRVTKPDSSILIEVPLSGLISELQGAKWRFLMPDEHVNIPSLRGVNNIFSHYGLKIQGVTRFGSGITSGAAPRVIKTFCDYMTKKAKSGDRGAFYCTRT